jgi:hypothetical protein
MGASDLAASWLFRPSLMTAIAAGRARNLKFNWLQISSFCLI